MSLNEQLIDDIIEVHDKYRQQWYHASKILPDEKKYPTILIYLFGCKQCGIFNYLINGRYGPGYYFINGLKLDHRDFYWKPIELPIKEIPD